MIIPLEALNSETLTAIIEQFVLSEGTDYGERCYSLEEKVAHVRHQLETGSAILVYSELHESVNIIPKDQYPHKTE